MANSPNAQRTTARQFNAAPLPFAASVLDQTWYVLNRAAQRLRLAVEEALEPLGLRRRHYAALGLLEAAAPLSQQELANRIPLDRASVVLVVDDLERLGFAERRPDPTDRRAYNIVLTPPGRDALHDARRRVAAAQAAGFAPLTADEVAALDALSRRICGWEQL